MSEFERISKNSVYSFLSIFFRLFSNVILFWLVARFYGKENFGQFTIAQTFASVYVIFADFGLDMLLTVELSRKLSDAKRLFQRYFSIKFILSLIAYIALILIGMFSGLSDEVKTLIYIFSFYALFTTLTNFLYALFKGNELLQYETKVSFFVNAFSLVVILIFILLEQSIESIAVVFAAMRFIGLMLALYFSYKIMPNISFKLDLRNISEIWNQVLVFGLFLIFGNLYFQIDTILLAYLTDEGSVGAYQAVFRLIMLPLIIPTIFINSILPALSRLNAVDTAKWNKLGFILNKFLIVTAIPIAIILYVFAEPIINIVYGGDEYSTSIPILKYFAIIVFIRFFAETFGLMLTTSNKQKIRMVIVLVATVLNVVINLILIPKLGINGAAMTSLFTNLFVACLFVLFNWRISVSWMQMIFKPTLLVLIILLILLSVVFSVLDLWYLSFILAVGYFLLIYKFYLNEEERNHLKDLKLMRLRT